MIDFSKILPHFLLNDKFLNDVAEIINMNLTNLNLYSQYLFFGDNLENFGDEILDKFAEDRGIFWYDSTLPLERKRNIIKNYRLTYRNLGTELAVKQLIHDYFGGNGIVENWYNYGGEHHMFKITIESNNIPASFVNRFIDALYWVKGVDTWLEFITFIQKLKNKFYFKIFPRDTIETSKIKQWIPTPYIKQNLQVPTIFTREKTIEFINPYVEKIKLKENLYTSTIKNYEINSDFINPKVKKIKISRDVNVPTITIKYKELKRICQNKDQMNN